MKKKIINKNTIEVIISKNDLRIHGITVLDLLGNHHEIETFFYQILNEVDTNHQFSDRGSLVFKVLPNKDGLKLIICKRARKPKKSQPSTSSTLPRSSVKNGNKDYRDSIIKLNDFEDFIKISRILKLDNGISNLYSYHGNYYLELYFNLSVNPLVLNQIKNKLAIACEYGNLTHLTPAMLMKDGKELINRKALEVGKKYFK